MTPRKERSPTVRIGFTKQALEALKPPPDGRYYAFDRKTPGLAIMVTDKNAKTFYVVRRIEGRPQRIRVGSLADLSIEQARREAARLNGEISLGRDPQEQRRLIRKQATLGDIFDHYRSTHLEPHCSDKSVREDVRRFDKHLAPWRNRAAVSLRPDEVALLHTRLGREAPVEANRVVGLLQRTLNHGRRQFGLDKSNVCDGLKRFREQSRDRFLQVEEVQRFFAALNADHDADLRDFVKLLLLTGVRKGNLERMAWRDVDLDRGVWRIGAEESKNAEPMLIVLPTAAVDILRSRNGGGDYVFRRSDGKLPNIKRGWQRIRAASELPDLRLHDCRRTLGSWQAALGTSLAIIGKSLGHKSARATSVYARLNLDPVRVSVEAATQALLAAATPTPTPKRKAKTA